MRQHRILGPSIVIALVWLCLAGSSSAQTTTRFTAGAMLGFGGTTGSGPSGTGDIFLRDDRFDLGFQLLFGMEVQRGTMFNVRLGQMDVEISTPALEQFGQAVDSELTYATLAGEYRLSAGSYQSGLFMGVGYYSVDGQNIFEDDTALGLTLGTTGDIRINDRWSVIVEFSGHYADLDYAQFFIMGHAGFAVHF